MFDKYISILGECFKDIMGKMARVDTADLEIIKDEQIESTYSIAQSIQYEDPEDKIKGDFILGFVDESTALMVASRVAESIGLAPAEKFDETASDIIGEFLNTVVGHTIAAWDSKGFKVRFSPPVMVKDKTINVKDSSDTEAYLIKINFSDDQVMLDSAGMNLVVTFTKFAEDKLTGKRILVVDDSNVMRTIVARAIEKKGVQVEQAKDGKEAIEKFKEFNPDLTIMDLVMPEMGGLDAIMEIQETNPDAKFIVLTSSSRRDEILAAKSLNVLAYILKPLNMEELIARIAKILK